CVCRTFESDVEASRALLRSALEPPHLERYGSEEIHWIADEAKRLMSIDPALIEELYRASFGRDEPSRDPSPIGAGRILVLISDRKQDWEHAWYQLAEMFPGFLNAAPEHAVRALISVVDSYVARKHPPSSGEILESEFPFVSTTAHIRTDYSEIWDSRESHI